MKTNIFKIAILALAISVSFSSCTKGDEPTPSNPTPVVVTPPTHIDSITVKQALAGSKWQLTDTIEVANDSITVVWKTKDHLNITNNVSDTLIYINSNSFYITQSSNPTLYNKFEYLDNPSKNVYRFNSGPGMPDKNQCSNQWITTFTKIN